jgi:hypothetical protein
MEFLNGDKADSCRAILTLPKADAKHASPRHSFFTKGERDRKTDAFSRRGLKYIKKGGVK